ncbi:hypothetical protein BN1232_04128 [Mycobacterium lentiflavum]|uniref:Uncharacterized protein n=1 Tax=Mycobacterium lentiflavum TaxID=141349 RepID=A0A0E4H0D8_MYCLN|nr:hypothetical protein BN1232_04128 [Mycobacterium lentiflavum]
MILLRESSFAHAGVRRCGKGSAATLNSRPAVNVAQSVDSWAVIVGQLHATLPGAPAKWFTVR